MIIAMMIKTGPMVITMMTSVMTSMMTSMMASMMALMMTIATPARTATDEEQHRGRESRVQQAQVSLKLLTPCLSLMNTVFLPIHQRWVWTIVSRSARKDVRLDRSQKVSAISSYLRLLHHLNHISKYYYYLHGNYFHHLQVCGRHLVVAAPDANQWTTPKIWDWSSWGLSSTRLLTIVTTNMIISHRR